MPFRIPKLNGLRVVANERKIRTSWLTTKEPLKSVNQKAFQVIWLEKIKMEPPVMMTKTAIAINKPRQIAARRYRIIALNMCFTSFVR